MATRPAAPARKRAGGAEDGVADPALPQKKRARHRLIGAIALCLLAAIVVPLLLESEPARPVNDIPIAIPSKDTPLPPRSAAPSAPAAPAAAPAPRAEAEAGRSGAVARGTIEPAAPAEARGGAPKVDAAKAPEAVVPDAKAADGKGADAKAGDAKAAAPRPADPKAAKAEPAKDEIQQLAEARMRGETVGRYLLQVGAFGAESSASAAVGRVQAAGLRAYTERVKTDRGERIRVRVGPFPSREAAERARQTLKAAGIEAAMIAP